MNFKQLFPSFRNRYRFVQAQLRQLSEQHRFERALNLGTGEGDYDRMIAGHVAHLTACDVNQADVDYARALNQGVMNLKYEINDALNLSYPNGNFDLLVSSEVIEHVGDPAKMLTEMYRVLAPGGWVIMTFPSREFPFSYDPVNRIWQWIRPAKSRERLIAQGAYAFGHDYLIGSQDFMKWSKDAGFQVVEFRQLSGWLIGLLEMYWTGIAQSLFKKNARNATSDQKTSLTLRPADTKPPRLVFLTDSLLWLDDFWFGSLTRSLGKGVILRKPL
jgi:ubiquinone/menaquinone biosynthesis C-methylase UbiE